MRIDTVSIRGNRYRVIFAGPKRIIRYLQENSKSKIALDIETTSLDPRQGKIRLITFYSLADPNKVFILDCFQNNNWKSVLPYIAKSTLIVHNGLFDLKYLYVHGMPSIPTAYDTIIASRIYYNGILNRGGLNSLKSNLYDLLGIDLAKNVDHSDWKRVQELSAEQVIYVCEDVIYLPALLEAWIEKLKKDSLVKTFQLELRTLKSFCWMESVGIPVDTKAWREIADFNESETVRYAEILDSITPMECLTSVPLFEGTTDINWNSVNDIKKAFARAGLNIKSTGDEVLAAIDHPLAINLRKYRKAKKAVGTYGKEWLKYVQPDGRLYCEWRQFGTDTGRLSCANPNLTQIPRDPRYRKSIKPVDEDWVIIKSDVSQFQLRIAARITKDPAMTKAYQLGSDLHTETAKLITGKSDVSKSDRTIAKPINFGLLFGMGAVGLVNYAKQEYNVDLTFDQAFDYHKKFFTRYRNLKKWHIWARNNFDRETRTRIGRRRILPDHCSYSLHLNSPVQGDEADAMKRSLADLFDYHDDYRNIFRPIMLVHDEIVLECRKDYAEEVKQILIDTMMKAIRETLDPVPGVVDAFVKEAWA